MNSEKDEDEQRWRRGGKHVQGDGEASLHADGADEY